MAPVTRHSSRAFNHKMTNGYNRKYKSLKYVHCTLHLDQIHNEGRVIKNVEKYKSHTKDKTIKQPGRIIYPLIFEEFNPEQLNSASRRGNVSFIIELNKLLARFPCIFNSGIHYSNQGGLTERFILTRENRDLRRYSPDIVVADFKRGGIWYREDEDNNILVPADPKSPEQLNIELNVDVLFEDLTWLREHWVREVLEHRTCDKYGDMCGNLMTRAVAWEALNTTA